MQRRDFCLSMLAAAAPQTLLAAANRPLRDWPSEADPRQLARRVIERFLAAPHMLWQERGSLHYAEVAFWVAAVEFARLMRDADLQARLAARLTGLQRDQPQLLPPPDHVDNSVFGALPLALYRSTKQKAWRELGLSYADTQWAKPRPDGMSDQTRFWIDDMYMITLLQTWAGRITGQRHYTDRAAQSMVAYLDRLQQPNGLFLHTPEAPFFWARGNGWMAAGMTELLAALPRRQPQRERILTDYRRMMRSLKAYQTDDGLWRQLIDQPDAWAESSGTAMFAFAMVSGVRHGWLEGDEFGEVARRAWLGLTKQVTPEGDVREVCVGTGARNDRQFYLDRPRITGDLHGQAPLLWTAVALLR